MVMLELTGDNTHGWGSAVSPGVPAIRLDSCMHVVALRTATYIVYI